MARKNEAHDIVMESLTIALLALMEAKPLSSINITELCKRAGVSRVSFYRNFASLSDILVRHLVKCTDDWWAVFSQKPQEEFYRDFLEELLTQYRRNEKLIKLLYSNGASYVLKEHIFACCGLSLAKERDALDAFARAALAGALYGILDEWIKRGMRNLPEGFSLRKIMAEVIAGE
jgi:AcrR family transcriptional regulator